MTMSTLSRYIVLWRDEVGGVKNQDDGEGDAENRGVVFAQRTCEETVRFTEADRNNQKKRILQFGVDEFKELAT